MSRWIKWVTVVMVVLVAVAIGVAAWTAGRRRSGRSFVFPDGTQVTLVSAEFPSPFIRSQSALTMERYDGGWRDWLYPKLPPKVLAKLGLQPVSQIIINTNSLAVWLKFRGVVSGTPQPADFRVRVREETGVETPDFWPYVTVSNKLALYVIPNYPHRSGEVNLEIYHHDASNHYEFAKGPTFVVHNPYPAGSSNWPATLSNWPALPLPARRTTNGVEITLTSLQSGVSNTSVDPGMMEPMDGGRAYSRAEFELREDGRPTTDWNMLDLKLSSATGESLMAGAAVGAWIHSQYAVVFPGALWSEEPAWELNVEFARTTNFTAEEVWNLKGIPVPGRADPRDTVTPVETNLSGVHLILLGLSPSSRMSGTDLDLMIEAENYSPDVQVSLLSVETESGQVLKAENSFVGVPASRHAAIGLMAFGFELSVPAGARAVDATFAITRSRSATFRVRPTVAR